MKSTTCDSVLVTKYGGAAMRRSKPALSAMVGEEEHFLSGGVGYVSADEPLSCRLVGEGVVDVEALLAGEAPELAHAPGASCAAGAE